MKNLAKTNRSLIGIFIISFLLIGTISCDQTSNSKNAVKNGRDHVYHSVLKKVRLGDGVPLDISVSVRWKINDLDKFSSQFKSVNKYDSLILATRSLELANNVSNKYPNVDTLFNSQRHEFISELKTYLQANLGEEGVTVKEVIISNLVFPKIFTNNKETLALQDQEMERIKKQSLIDIEKTEALKLEAEGNGKVAMAEAEMNAKVQKIKALTEKSIRLTRLAKAETEKQVSRLKAQADAERKRLMAKADLAKKKDLKDLDMIKKSELDQIALIRKKQLGDLEFNTEMRMAKLCSDNPTYATYIVNKELASKVQIAVLPNNQDGSIFNSFLNTKSTK